LLSCIIIVLDILSEVMGIEQIFMVTRIINIVTG